MDSIITRLTEDPFLAGNNSSNSVIATVNGELVNGIDPRTVPGTTSNPDGLNYDADIQNLYGKANASFDKTQTEAWAVLGLSKNKIHVIYLAAL